MRKYVLILSLVLELGANMCIAFEPWLEENNFKSGEVPVASTAKLTSHRPPYGYYGHNYRGYNHRPYRYGRRNPFQRRGVITGFTPPINSGGYYVSGYPAYISGTTETLGTKIKRVLNPNYYNIYRNNPAYAPYTNANLNNLNTLNNGRYVPLFRGTSQGGLFGNNPQGNNFNGWNTNGLSDDGNGMSESGTTVTIID